MKNEAIPRLRFKGFNNRWLTNTLNHITTHVDYRGKTPHKVNKGIQLITAKNIKKGYINYKINKEYISSRDYSKVMHRGIPHKGDVLFTTEAPVGNTAQINNVHIALAQRVIKFTGKYNILNNTFLANLFLSQGFRHILHSYSTGGTVKGIKGRVLVKINIHYPKNICEQQLIGKFFAKLDKLIQLQQKKVALLKKLKRGYLQKLFPQPGTYVPSLRFKGFSKPWSCSKAGTLFKSISEKNHPKLPVLSSTQTKGLVYRKDLNSDIKYNPKSLPNYKVIHKGDFVISLRSFQGGFECSNKLGIISTAYTVFNFINRFNQDTYFWKTFFKSYIFLQLLKKITFGIRDGKSIKFTGFKSLKLKYPSYKEECKLGKLFKNMNNNIDIQKNKLTHLRKLKKAYLQKMFC